MTQQAFQDLLGAANHCHGCGALNEKGLQIKSYWDGDTGICQFTPQPHHSAGHPSVVNGGIIASIIDCHSVNTAMAAAYKAEGREMGSAPLIWYVTASLNIQYLKPTPIDVTLLLRASISKTEGRKTWVSCALTADALHCAQGEVLAIRVPRVD